MPASICDRPRRLRRLVVGALALGFLVYFRYAPRPTFLPLVTEVDGPPPAEAAGVVVFLHGRGGSLTYARRIARGLREQGLPRDVAILMVEGPYRTWYGHSWGSSDAEQAHSRARVRDLLQSSAPRAGRVVVAGFSQGAGVAIDLAVEEPRVNAMASIAPCASWLRGALPKRHDLRILLVHGAADDVCPVEESRSLARVLEAAHKPARYLELPGGHAVPPEALRAIVELIAADGSDGPTPPPR